MPQDEADIVAFTKEQINDLGQALKVLIDIHNQSARVLGEKLGVAPGTITALTDEDRRNPNPQTLTTIAKNIENLRPLFTIEGFRSHIERAIPSLVSVRKDLTPKETAEFLTCLVNPSQPQFVSGEKIMEATLEHLLKGAVGEYAVLRHSLEPGKVVVSKIEIIAKEDVVPIFEHTYVDDHGDKTESSGYVFLDGSYMFLLGKRKNSPKFMQIILDRSDRAVETGLMSGLMLSLSVGASTRPFATNIYALPMNESLKTELYSAIHGAAAAKGASVSRDSDDIYGVYDLEVVRSALPDSSVNFDNSIGDETGALMMNDRQ